MRTRRPVQLGPGAPRLPRPERGRPQAQGKAVGSFGRLDDPEHARYRKMPISEFTARRIEALRPQVAETVGLLLDRMAAGPRPAAPVTTQVVPWDDVAGAFASASTGELVVTRE
jgi:cytochrome P450